ncbi:hypothetical protein HRbin14_01571 [bacterium HR14]|nr:hypothetical protein HRbin14_01571 [bacterium HR14]
MSPFTNERAAFQALKIAVEQDEALRADIEKALKELLGRFSTAIRENRFVVGGALELILVAALRAAGVDAQHVGVEEERIDIKLEKGGFSVKGHFSRSGGAIRLINTLGESEETKWETATLFVIHGVGFGYADPELIPEEQVERVKDALVLKYKVVRRFLSAHPHYLINLSIPPLLSDVSSSELVSRTLAREILQRTSRLKDYID